MGTFETLIIMIFATIVAVAFNDRHSAKSKKEECKESDDKEMSKASIETDMRDYGLSYNDFCEPSKYEKDHYTIRMDITMDRKMSYEEAEKVIFNALRSAGMKAHKGGIS